MAKRTPEEIDALEREVQQFRAEQAKAAAAELRTAAKPLLDFVASPAFGAMKDAAAALRPLTLDPRFDQLRTYVDCMKSAVDGLTSMAATIPAAATSGTAGA